MAINGIIGRKIGMTQLFLENGRMVPVTAVQAGPCTVTQLRIVGRDGYQAVQLGFEVAKRLTKPESGHLRHAGKLFRHLREVPGADLGDVEVGQEIGADVFAAGERVDVIGTSKGRGFTGVVKRHGFAGGPKTHGQSDRHRAPGSIGGTTYPGRVMKGTKMAGHWGAERVTVQNMEVVRVDPERQIIFIRGAVPGASRGLIQVLRVKKGRK
jgi:large subunit ribosomal protein L3